MLSRAFTIVQLLVVLGIIALLAALLFPVLRSASGRAQMGQCANNLQQIGSALKIYAADYDDRLPCWPMYTARTRSGNHFVAAPQLWRDSLAAYGLADTNFWCPLDPYKGDASFIGPSDTPDAPRAAVTSYQKNPLMGPGPFGTQSGHFNLSLVRLPDRWPWSLSETVYLIDALWPTDPATSSHGEFANRLYLDGHVKHSPISADP